jgi:hypothetical protein
VFLVGQGVGLDAIGNHVIEVSRVSGTLYHHRAIERLSLAGGALANSLEVSLDCLAVMQ